MSGAGPDAPKALAARRQVSELVLGGKESGEIFTSRHHTPRCAARACRVAPRALVRGRRGKTHKVVCGAVAAIFAEGDAGDARAPKHIAA